MDINSSPLEARSAYCWCLLVRLLQKPTFFYGLFSFFPEGIGLLLNAFSDNKLFTNVSSTYQNCLVLSIISVFSSISSSLLSLYSLIPSISSLLHSSWSLKLLLLSYILWSFLFISSLSSTRFVVVSFLHLFQKLFVLFIISFPISFSSFFTNKFHFFHHICWIKILSSSALNHFLPQKYVSSIVYSITACLLHCC